ncbi:hypothetical protein FS837_007540 [Tulasnella sp. UAMH 9824]|nr:hypothetical protein FS837_007540 [Tulasnella sp. UAMH 9824]
MSSSERTRPKAFIVAALAPLRMFGGRMFAKTGADDVSYIIGGGAFHAADKIVQHNGAGTVQIKNFYANNFGKSYARHVVIDNVAMMGGSSGVGINEVS